MEYTEASLARIFILRLHQDETVHEVVEKFAKEKQVKNALCFFLGGADEKSKLVVGPKDGKAMPPEIMTTMLRGVHEGLGVGTIFCDESGQPKLHMHGSFGRNDAQANLVAANAVTGCMRVGVQVWKIGEVAILELAGAQAMRKKDKATGFEMLEI
jgi:predicted DNA-binding protein with PD1-like motif